MLTKHQQNYICKLIELKYFIKIIKNDNFDKIEDYLEKLDNLENLEKQKILES